MAAQVSRAEAPWHAHDVVRNEAGLAALRADVVALHGRYLELAKQVPSPA